MMKHVTKRRTASVRRKSSKKNNFDVIDGGDITGDDEVFNDTATSMFILPLLGHIYMHIYYTVKKVYLLSYHMEKVY